MTSFLVEYGSLAGRISRGQLALRYLLPFILVLVAIDLINQPAVSALLWVLVAWPVFAAGPWKRLHDMGRTGKWNLAFYGFYALGFAFFLGEYTASEGGWAALFDGQDPTTVDNDLTASGLGGFSTILIFLPVHLFWLYLIPGNRTDNRYGPPPRAKE